MERKLLRVPLYIWIIQIVYVIVSLSLLLFLLQSMTVGSVSFWGRKLFIIVFVVVMLAANVLWRLLIRKKRNVLTVIVILFAFLLNSVVAQVFTLRSAHSSFDNYYHFRGCVQLITKSDTEATCKLASGETIKIVDYKDEWYLDGDLPNSSFGF